MATRADVFPWVLWTAAVVGFGADWGSGAQQSSVWLVGWWSALGALAIVLFARRARIAAERHLVLVWTVFCASTLGVVLRDNSGMTRIVVTLMGLCAIAWRVRLTTHQVASRPR